MAKRRLFTVKTPLGHSVILTRDRWREIIRYKHPALAGHEEQVRLSLSEPDVIRASVLDADVHLYYRATERGFLCTVVGGTEVKQRFIITAYFTKALKEGHDLWTK
jgi:hypothetical protein